MTGLRGRAVRLVVAVCLAAGVVAAVPAPARCTEDMSCWSCVSMGNRVCGMVRP